jgi:hypothetical protein
MTQTHRSPAASGSAPTDADPDRLTGWVGWVLFAAIVMFTAGIFNIIEGLVALFNSDYYAVRPSGLVLHVDYTAWGWALLIFGALLAGVGYGVAVGQTWARVVAVVVAALNTVVNLGFIAAYPVWIVLTVTLDIIVIYALIVHGREARVLRR